jgi:septum formation protein
MSKPNTLLPIVSQINAQFSVVLGSGSPRRKELLALMGFNSFAVKLSNFAEDLVHATFSTPQQYCLETARRKIQHIADDFGSLHDKTLLVGADTIVEVDGTILEKPKDAADSRRMLMSLSNRAHFVHTAVVVYANSNDLSATLIHVAQQLHPLLSFVETTKVTFGELADSDVDAYVALGEGLDKAGSYGIQGTGALFVQAIDGCYFSVMGLPVHRLSKELATAFRP